LRTSALSRFAVSLLALAALLAVGAFAQAPAPLPAPINLDFEQGRPGEVPPGWFNSSAAKTNGYTAKIVTDQPNSGKQAVLVTLEGERKDPKAFGNLLTFFDATPYRGKRIRFRAAVRAEVGAGNQAALWLRVDREGGAVGFFDNMADRPITSSEWKTYEISGTVDPDAKAIFVGLMLLSQGKAWIDSTSFEVLGAAVNADEPARPLDARGLDNLVAFTRLLGYVRFFHPSDQAAAADWGKVAVAGARIAEKPRSPEELARALEDFFRPLAPAVRVFSTAGPRPQLPAGLKPPAGAARPEVVYWEHQGVRLGEGSNIYKSARVHGGEPPHGGQVAQTLEAGSYKGRRVIVRAAARVGTSGGSPVLRLKAYDPKDTAVALAQSPAGSSGDGAGEWRIREVSAEVPKDAAVLEIDLGLAGEGRVWWDDVSVEVEGGTGAAAPLDNPGFETAGYVGVAGWDLPWDARRAGYGAELSEDRPKSGRHSLLVSWTKPDPAAVPRPEEPLVADLGGGVSALIPLALYQDGKSQDGKSRDGKSEDGQGTTLPHAAPDDRPPVPAKPEGWVPSGNDRATRLADVALAWNVFQHFYPYFDVVQADWPGELRRALSAAATDADDRAFLKTLRLLVAALHDGHGGVYLASQDAPGQLPLLWDWVEDQLVVTQIAATGAGDLKPGDVVLAIDGRPAWEALADGEALISGATPQWRRWNAAHRLGWGKRDEPVRLEARHLDGTTFTAGLTRSIPLFGPGSLEETRPEKIAELKPGIFYVDVSRIEAEDLKAALDRLAGARGIVFDLRGYPTDGSLAAIAHLTDQPVSTARWNVPVVTHPDRQGWQWDISSWSIQPQAPRFRAKAAFLTDGRAISYAETYMGIVENYHLAEIVGGPTAGTNGNVNPFVLPGGYRLTWTGMKVLKHDGSQHHGVGIQPTVPASRTLKGVAAGRDELLEKGIAVVSQ
jgi:C-terminal processing protease CtpA/Prc